MRWRDDEEVVSQIQHFHLAFDERRMPRHDRLKMFKRVVHLEAILLLSYIPLVTFKQHGEGPVPARSDASRAQRSARERTVLESELPIPEHTKRGLKANHLG